MNQHNIKGNTMKTILKLTNIERVAVKEALEAIRAAPKGSLLIYYRGAVGRCSPIIMRDARAAAAGIGELCQKPTQSFDRRGYRIWDYMIQKHSVPA
jgi:hypothetical protein